MSDYKVWECKIVVSADAILPDGFDAPPRSAAIDAVLAADIPVIACLSGWGGKLTSGEKSVVEGGEE